MSKTRKIIMAIVGVIIIAGGVWAITAMNKPKDTNTNSTSSENQKNSSSEPSSNSTETVITYTSSGFEPASVTVKSGGKLKITNNSSEPIEFASDPHPTHTLNPELNTSDIEPNSSTTITVTKVGSWGYHNHYDPSKRGTIVVE
jgi:plastocyanin